MPTIDEIMNEKQSDTTYNEGQGTYTTVHNPEVIERPRLSVPEWLKAPTGEGSIESYVNHPLNFNGSMGLAQVIRGLTGMFNNLDYAIIDILMGTFKMSNASKPKGAAANGNDNLRIGENVTV